MTTPANLKQFASTPTTLSCPLLIHPASFRSCSSHDFHAPFIISSSPHSTAGSRESNTPTPFGPSNGIPTTTSLLAAGPGAASPGLVSDPDFPSTAANVVKVAARSFFSSSDIVPQTSNLAQRRNRGVYARATAERSARLSYFKTGLKITGGIEMLENDEQAVWSSQTCICDTSAGPFDTWRQRIVESEQCRRNDLRGGFARLKDALPISHEKCSKMVLLDRATAYIGHLKAKLQRAHGAVSVQEIHCYGA